MIKCATSGTRRSRHVGRPTTVTFHLSKEQEHALTHCAKVAMQSVPTFVANLVRRRLAAVARRKDAGERFDPAAWYATILQTGHDAAVVEFVEGDLQVLVIGPRDNPQIGEQLKTLAAHRDEIIDHLLSRQSAHTP